MATLLVAIVTSVLMAVFATQNTAQISLNFGSYILTGIPIYLAVLVPLLIGLIVAFLLHLMRDLSQNLTINEQKSTIKNLKKELAEVTKHAHKYQLESAKLKSENGSLTDEDSI